jgi:hypothetical protein
MPAAGMLGSAIGAGAPTVVANSGVRGRLTPLKDLKGIAPNNSQRADSKPARGGAGTVASSLRLGDQRDGVGASQLA